MKTNRREVKLSPWFNVFTEPPVAGDMSAVYQVRCMSIRHFEQSTAPVFVQKYMLDTGIGYCRRCEWRGVLR